MPFSRATFDFLRSLAANNEVHWFHDHRGRYLRHVRAPALELVHRWGAALGDDYLGRATAVGGAISPPNRDTRFSRDKSPYRSHVAIRMRHRLALPGAPGPAFLLWLEPGRCFLAAGVHGYRPESARRIRDAIQARPDDWDAVRRLGRLDDQGLFQRAPVPDDHALFDDLRRRHYTVTVPLRHADVLGETGVRHIIESSRRMRPFADFTARALYGSRSVQTAQARPAG